MNSARPGPTVAVATSDRAGYNEEQEVAMTESATHATEHTTEDQNDPAAAAPDERDNAAQARRTRQMALIDGVVRDYEPVLRELFQR